MSVDFDAYREDEDDAMEFSPKKIRGNDKKGEKSNTAGRRMLDQKIKKQNSQSNKKQTFPKKHKFRESKRNPSVGHDVDSGLMGTAFVDQIARMRQQRLKDNASSRHLDTNRNSFDDNGKKSTIDYERRVDADAMWGIICDDDDGDRKENNFCASTYSIDLDWENRQDITNMDHVNPSHRREANNVESGHTKSYIKDKRKNKEIILTKQKSLRNKGGVLATVEGLDGGEGDGIANRFDVEERHKAKLVEIVNKRKQDDELSQMAFEKAAAKRKKFKDALLEKALKARLDALIFAGPVAAELNPAFKEMEVAEKGKGGIKRKGKETGAVETEESRMQEEARIEQVAIIRRKFKEQHKNTLLSLMNKHKEEEKKIDDFNRNEEEKKRRRKIKAELIAAKKAEALLFILQQEEDGRGDDHLTPSGQNRHRDERLESTSAKASRGKSGSFTGPAAGSGLAGVRAYRAQSAEAGQQHRYDEPEAQDLSVLVEDEGIGGQGSPGAEEEITISEEEVARKVKRIAAKMHQAKIAAYLVALAEQKRKDENEKKKKEERARRRMMILSARVQSEASERRLMTLEDQFRHQNIVQVSILSKDKDKERKRVKADENDDLNGKNSPKNRTQPFKEKENRKFLEERKENNKENERNIDKQSKVSSEVADAMILRLSARIKNDRFEYF